MALVVKSARASMDTSNALTALQLTGDLYAGENLDKAAICYINADGTVRMSNGAVANAAAVAFGITPKEYFLGEPVTLFVDARFKYSEGELTPGQALYVATTAGRLDNAATVGGTLVTARAISAHDIIVRCLR